MRTRVKICGITKEDDAKAAWQCGADAVGFIFYPRSPRAVPPGVVRGIIAGLPPFVTPVGVFVSATVEEILTVVDESGIRAVQLHGNEPREYVQAMPCPVIKVFRPAPGFEEKEFEEFRGCTLMIDTYRPGVFGGTGATSDWDAAIRAKTYGRLILSGGLTPTNVQEAIRIVQPYAVDVSSGVEKHPGAKDPALMRQFIAAVRKADELESCP